jgi:hypothetical protein
MDVMDVINPNFLIGPKSRLKLEQEITTAIQCAIRAEDHRTWVYKIPDSPTAERFMIPKPCDLVGSIGRYFFGAEVKAKPGRDAIGMRDMRPSQIKNLNLMERGGNFAVVLVYYRLLGASQGDTEHRLYCFEWPRFKSLCEEGGGSIKWNVVDRLRHEKFKRGIDLTMRYFFEDFYAHIVYWPIMNYERIRPGKRN